MTDNRRDEICKLKQSGKTYAQIAEIMNISRQRVHRIISPEPISGGGICDDCGLQFDHLEKHHTSYVPEITKNLCRSCHRSAHKPKGRKMAITNSQEKNLSQGLREYCEKHGVGAPALAAQLNYGYQHAWRLLAGLSPVTAETFGRFVLAYGFDAAQELLSLAGVATDTLPHADDAQVVPVVFVTSAA
jgi:hypothetical protein